jgi:hypothetical protein
VCTLKPALPAVYIFFFSYIRFVLSAIYFRRFAGLKCDVCMLPPTLPTGAHVYSIKVDVTYMIFKLIY